MKRLESRMTRKGQVTIPVELRREMGLSPGDVVKVEARDGWWVVSPRRSRLLEVFGAVTPGNRPEDWRAIREEVEEAIGRELAAEERSSRERRPGAE